MPSKILLDSSILVEYRKGTQTDLLDAILLSPNWKSVITQSVVSEYLFFHLAIFSGKAPLSVKTANEIGQYLKVGDPGLFLSQFDWLEDNPGLFISAIHFMEKYNLLPNDALIIANCIAHQIKTVASFDQDFIIPCQGEGITLVDKVALLNNTEPPLWESLVNEP